MIIYNKNVIQRGFPFNPSSTRIRESIKNKIPLTSYNTEYLKSLGFNVQP